MTDDQIRQARRLCFFAHYHPRGVVSDAVVIYLRALRDAGFSVVVLSTADLDEGEQSKLGAECSALIMRDNVGLDFGGWIEAYQRFMPIEADLLLLANDSVYAPFGDLSAFIERLLAVPADFYGAVESREMEPHLQSWFLLLRPTAYRSAPFRELLTSAISADTPKWDIIRNYELGVTRRLRDAGLTYHAGWSAAGSGPIARTEEYNPMHLLWRSMIASAGVPFLKVEVLRDNPTRVGKLGDWQGLTHLGPPGFAEAIAQDLVLRKARPLDTVRERLDWSLHHERSAFWPELHGFYQRDATSNSRMLRTVNHRVFAAAVWTLRRLRWRVKTALGR